MLVALLLPAQATPTHAQMDAASWSAVTTVSHKDAGDVGVWRATVDGVECFRGTALVDVAPSKLLATVKDIAGTPRWSTAGVTEAKLLASSGSTLDYYQYLDIPAWTMASDRFWFLTSKVESSETRAVFRWDKLENGGAHSAFYQEVVANHSGAVEPTVNVGAWIFEKKEDGTHLGYQICTLPGGSIPLAIQNAATRKTLPDTVGDVVRDARTR